MATLASSKLFLAGQLAMFSCAFTCQPEIYRPNITEHLVRVQTPIPATGT